MTDSNRNHRALKIACYAAAALVAIGGAFAYAHQAGGHGGHMGQQNAQMHLDHLAAVLTKIGVSEAQRSQVVGLMRPAFADMKSVHDSHWAAFGQFHELLFAPSIDRGKIDSLRADQIKSIDAASRRVTTAFADAAEVLSPEQRAAFAAEMRAHHGG